MVVSMVSPIYGKSNLCVYLRIKRSTIEIVQRVFMHVSSKFTIENEWNGGKSMDTNVRTHFTITRDLSTSFILINGREHCKFKANNGNVICTLLHRYIPYSNQAF